MIIPTRNGVMAAMAQYYEALSRIAHIGALPPLSWMGYQFSCE
ncbi:MAG: hypothetical protein ABIT23_09080 [Nitrosospira sp.]